LSSCNDANAPHCLKTTGDIQQYSIAIDDFTSIDVHNNIHVTIEQGMTQSVTLTTGTNMVDDITFEVIAGDLIIKDLNKCDWVRPYGNLHVHIVTPELSKIRSSGGGTITSKGILSFTEPLSLISEFYTADFILDIDMQRLRIVNNDLSNYYISGNVTDLDIGFYSGDGRFEGIDLTAENAIIFHRGTNDIRINATHSLTGEISKIGNVIYCIVPTIIDVEILDDRGELIQSCN
jgi:hypothetical protein